MKDVTIVMDLHELAPVGGQARRGDTGGGSSGSPRCMRIFRIGPGSVMNAISRMSPPHAGHSSGPPPILAKRFAQAIRGVSCEIRICEYKVCTMVPE